MNIKSIFFFFALFFVFALPAQNTVTFTCSDSLSGENLPGVIVLRNGKGIGAANTEGKLSLQIDSAQTLVFRMTGYLPKTIRVKGNEGSVFVHLLPLSPEMETFTVTSTRNNSRIDDTPTKTEVLGEEELGEENGIKPGNVSSMLGDISSIQIQNTAAVSGQSTLRIQGLDGRYTQMLRDGLPVYDGFASGFNIMQLPPLDLKQIELIKGPASTLYGGGAIGGLVNFISRTPGDSASRSVTANITSLQEGNLNFWSSEKWNAKTGYTFLGAGTYANAIDVNKDGFSDVPAIRQVLLHPRFFYEPDKKHAFIFGIDGTWETREGGDMQVLAAHTDSIHRFFERNETKRLSGEFIFHYTPKDSSSTDIRCSSTIFDRRMNTENGKFNGTQWVNYGEISHTLDKRAYGFVYGISVLSSRFEQAAPVFNQGLSVNRNTIGAFSQVTWRLTKMMALEAGFRMDFYSDSSKWIPAPLPRLAYLWKWNDRTGMRLSAGMGYKTVNPLQLAPTEHLLPLYSYQLNTNIQTEKSIGGSFDVYWRRRLGDKVSLYMNQSFFATQVSDPFLVNNPAGNHLYIFNAASPLLTYGSDSYIRLTTGSLELYMGYTWTHAMRTYNDAQPFLPVTPVHRLSFVLFYEAGEHWRAGLEGSFMGKQYREDGTGTPSYMFGAMMVAYQLNAFTFVLNTENLLNVLQSDYEKLYTGSISAPSFNPLWAPVDGRVVNFSLRFNW